MEKDIIVKNENMTLWYYPDTKIIHHEFHQYTKGQILRDGLSAGPRY